jgi:hypothetical protein
MMMMMMVQKVKNTTNDRKKEKASPQSSAGRKGETARRTRCSLNLLRVLCGRANLRLQPLLKYGLAYR